MIFGRYERVMGNYLSNFEKYSCNAPTLVFQQCCGECILCKFSAPKENPYKFSGQDIEDKEVSTHRESKQKLLDFVLSLPYEVAEQYLTDLENKLKERK